MLVILLCGCSEESRKQENKLDPIETSVNLDSNNKDKLFNKFKNSVPDATVYNTAMLEMDGDKIDDLIVIFDTPEKKTNFSIVTGRSVSTIALEGNDYSFTYVLNSLKVDKSQKKFIITLHDETKNFTVDYEMTMVYDMKKNARTVKIESINPR